MACSNAGVAQHVMNSTGFLQSMKTWPSASREMRRNAMNSNGCSYQAKDLRPTRHNETTRAPTRDAPKCNGFQPTLSQYGNHTPTKHVEIWLGPTRDAPKCNESQWTFLPN